MKRIECSGKEITRDSIRNMILEEPIKHGEYYHKLFLLDYSKNSSITIQNIISYDLFFHIKHNICTSDLVDFDHYYSKINDEMHPYIGQIQDRLNLKDTILKFTYGKRIIGTLHFRYSKENKEMIKVYYWDSIYEFNRNFGFQNLKPEETIIGHNIEKDISIEPLITTIQTQLKEYSYVLLG